MSSQNKLYIAAAGAGKTTFLVKEALKVKDKQVLITTYTEANEQELHKKFIEIHGSIPSNIKIQTWFSFLLKHGVRPYQSILNDVIFDRKVGFHLTEKISTKYIGENDFLKYYFSGDANLKIYSDKVSKFIIETDNKLKEARKPFGEIIDRISRIYPYIFIDEVQDLAGWDLEIIKRILLSNSVLTMFGDPRQVTYLTHHSRKYPQYKNGAIAKFIQEECPENICDIDYITLKRSHRNNKEICDYSSALFPNYERSEPCTCAICRDKVPEHTGIFLLNEYHVASYIKLYEHELNILRYKSARIGEWTYGRSKGQTFNRTLIYPTTTIRKWIIDIDEELADSTKCKFYVALTRARFSVAIVMPNTVDLENSHLPLYEP